MFIAPLQFWIIEAKDVLSKQAPHENPTNQGSEDIHNSQNFNWGRESHIACFTRFECLQSVECKPRISLPKTYTKEDLPVDSWEVATA